MNKALRHYWYLVWIVNALLAASLFWFYQFVIKEETRAEALRRDGALQEESRRLLKEREERFVAWQPYQNQLTHFFFAKDRLVDWLEFLENEARARHLVFEVSSLDEKNTETSPHLQAMLRGTAADTIEFLHAVQIGPYGIGIQEGVMRKGSSFEERVTQVTFIFYEDS